jgi:hypothetical protein
VADRNIAKIRLRGGALIDQDGDHGFVISGARAE